MSERTAEAVREYIERQGPAIAPGGLGEIRLQRRWDGSVRCLCADPRISVSLQLLREASDDLVTFQPDRDGDGNAWWMLTLAFENGPLRYVVLGHDGRWADDPVIICERIDE